MKVEFTTKIHCRVSTCHCHFLVISFHFIVLPRALLDCYKKCPSRSGRSYPPSREEGSRKGIAFPSHRFLENVCVHVCLPGLPMLANV